MRIHGIYFFKNVTIKKMDYLNFFVRKKQKNMAPFPKTLQKLIKYAGLNFSFSLKVLRCYFKPQAHLRARWKRDGWNFSRMWNVFGQEVGI